MTTDTVFISSDGHQSTEGDGIAIEVERKAALVISTHKNPAVILHAALEECGWNVPSLDDVIVALAKMQVAASN